MRALEETGTRSCAKEVRMTHFAFGPLEDACTSSALVAAGVVLKIRGKVAPELALVAPGSGMPTTGLLPKVGIEAFGVGDFRSKNGLDRDAPLDIAELKMG